MNELFEIQVVKWEASVISDSDAGWLEGVMFGWQEITPIASSITIIHVRWHSLLGVGLIHRIARVRALG